MKNSPLRRGSSARLRAEVDRGLRRDLATLPDPSSALRPRILHALREERRPREATPHGAPGMRLRLVAIAAAVVVVLLLWDPSGFRRKKPLPPPNAFMEQLLALSDPAPLVEAVDRPLRSELGHLVTDTTRVAGGLADRLTASPFAHLLSVGARGADGR